MWGQSEQVGLPEAGHVKPLREAKTLLEAFYLSTNNNGFDF
jgi:hypothetical protein